jgi:hypothetical protein
VIVAALLAGLAGSRVPMPAETGRH